MINDNSSYMSPFVDALISARQSIKTYILGRMKEMDINISYEMFQVLHVLWRKSEVNQQEIANAVQKGKGSLTPLIDNLVNLKLVTRTEDHADRRNKIISLTKEGKDFKKKFEPIINDFYKQFEAGADEHKIREMTVLLNKMTQNTIK